MQKDSKGRYFKNDKLVYLAFFLKKENEGNWRLPTRYYAVNAAEDRLEKYYEENFKNTKSIIDSHMGFFDSMSEIEKVTVMGCSLSPVDMEYFKTLRDSVKDNVKWEFSCHTDSDKKRISKFCKDLFIKDADVTKFTL